MKIQQILASIEHLSPDEREILLHSLKSPAINQERETPDDFAARIQREVPTWNAESYREYRRRNP